VVNSICVKGKEKLVRQEKNEEKDNRRDILWEGDEKEHGVTVRMIQNQNNFQSGKKNQGGGLTTDGRRGRRLSNGGL